MEVFGLQKPFTHGHVIVSTLRLSTLRVLTCFYYVEVIKLVVTRSTINNDPDMCFAMTKQLTRALYYKINLVPAFMFIKRAVGAVC